MKNIAVILSGCGVYDGAEIHESVLSLLAIKKAGANYQCFAPNVEQMHVINHLTGQESETPRRNVLVESARIARGDIQSLSDFDAQLFDGLLVPGGFGAAKNLSNFAVQGSECEVEASVLAACQAIARLNKPAAYLCIAPVMMPQIYGAGVKLTIGNDPETAAAIEAMGGRHVPCLVTDSVFDEANNVLSTPAYMLAQDIAEAAIGIEKTVNKLIALC